MREDTVVTGQNGNGNKPAGVAGWSVPGYTELKALGSGGSGDVVLARHDASGTRVAIKYLRRKLLADPQWAGLFRSEAQVLASLDDPNIVQLYEYVESPSGAAIVMELVDGVSIREILTRQGATTPEAALVVLRGSLLGLATAHRRGVVHRDYKPENVLVDGKGDSKLTDFGIAARTGEEPVAAGSLLYAPPEQFGGTPASPAGDVYAATATFYECLTGRPPFVGDTAERLLYQHLTEPVPLDPVPEPVRPLVAAGMAKEPGNRPADATTFVTALEAIAARAYGPDWAERGRLALGAAALLLAALWPSGPPAGVNSPAVKRVKLSRKAQDSRESQESRHLWHLRHLWHVRHLLHLRNRRKRLGWQLGSVKAAVTIGAAAAVVATAGVLAVHLAGHSSGPTSATLPAITSVSPADGTDMGGTPVTITGTGLAGATRVTFGGVPGKIITDSDTRITVASPPSTDATGSTVTAAAITDEAGARITGTSQTSTGTVDITVTTAAGTSTVTVSDHFTYTAPQPEVTSIIPDDGSTTGGTTVSITGAGLAGATEVRFGPARATITAASNTQVTVISPPGTGTVTVTVTTPAGASPATAVGHYTYTTRPERTQSISFTAPASAAAGSSATLSASGGGSGNPVVFSVDRASAPGVCTVASRTVTYAQAGPCVIDANQAGNAGYTAAPQVQRTVMVNSGTKLDITSVTPPNGPAGGGTSVIITGSGFTGVTGVSFGGKAAASYTVDGAGQITATSPADTGTVDITVTTTAGTSPLTTADHFTYTTKTTVTATSTALSSSANPSVAGQQVTFTATVRANPPGAGTPAGTVTFSDGGTMLGTETLNNSGVATFATSALKADTHKITASYGGDQNFGPSMGGPLTQTVNTLLTVTATATVSPTSYSGSACPVEFAFSGTIHVSSGPVTVEYEWIRSEGDPGSVQSIDFTGSGAQDQKVTGGSWTPKANGTYWGAIQIISPGSAQSNEATFTLNCQVAATATATVSPTSYSGSACPAVFTFSGTIHVSSGPVTVTYEWIRSDGATGPEQTIDFTDSGAQDQSVAPETWTLSANGTYWEAIQIISPGPAQSNEATFTLSCQAPQVH